MITVEIEGSTGTPYTATFTRDGDRLITTCTCGAGESKMHCKHRLSLFAGDFSHVRGAPPADLSTQIMTMLEGSTVAAALASLAEAETAAEAAKANVKRAKKSLDRAMHA